MKRLSEDVRKHSALDIFSCFPHQSYLKKLKPLPKGPVRPNEEAYKRLHQLNVTSSVIKAEIPVGYVVNRSLS